MLFDRWYSSKEVAQDFTKLRQLILIEEFKGCYIEEQKAESIQQAARLADDYWDHLKPPHLIQAVQVGREIYRVRIQLLLI